MQMFIGVVLGGLIGWIITHLYYKKSSNDLHEIVEKLPESIIQPILEDKREHLTVSELNELLKTKTIDSETNDPLPYIACPKCGSGKLNRSSATDYDRDEMYFIINCEDCGWSQWTQ